MSELIASKLGGYDYLKDFTQMHRLEQFLDDKQFRSEWAGIKHANKVRLAKFIKDTTSVTINPSALFDIQVKRMHEYKRQQLNIFGAIHRYLTLKKMTPDERKNQNPHVTMIGGKSAPGYWMAKVIIRLINAVGEIVNNDKDVGDLMKVIFIEDYNVSKCELIVPASDVSEHISTAGTEGSGTSCVRLQPFAAVSSHCYYIDTLLQMKFVMNGGLLIGTCDGANIEITREIGEDNIFLFGNLAEQVEDLRHAHLYSANPPPLDADLAAVFAAIRDGTFGDPSLYNALLDSVEHNGDYYLVSDDFHSYLETQRLIEREFFGDREAWLDKCITATARMGFFSSDRCIAEYAEGIWNVEPVHVKNEAAEADA